MKVKKLDIIGAALGWGAQLHETEDGPRTLKNKGYFPEDWRCIVGPYRPYVPGKKPLSYEQRLKEVVRFDKNLIEIVKKSVKKKNFPIIIGGDHSTAIGTWNALAQTKNGKMGLIWMDAHMDAHTPKTTPSNAIHGMPVAVLLGHGEEALLRLGEAGPTFKPEQIVLVGVRSFEEGEEALLKSLNVKIYDMQLVRERGLDAVMAEAREHILKSAESFGISFDLDAFDPKIAPGVGSPEKNGLMREEVMRVFARLSRDSNFIALEISELNPKLDKDDLTVNLVSELVESLRTNKTQKWIARENAVCANNYEPIPVVIEKGKGVWLWDIEGRRYLDMMSAYSAVSFGHSHPKLVKALKKQSKKLAVTSRAFFTDALKPFLEKLCAMSKMDMALPSNSGVEAVETALKAARKWGYENKGIPKNKAEIIVARNNFHGRTISVVSFSSEALYKEGFGPLTPGFKEIPFGDASALNIAITPNTCAFLVEPIQGEAGIIIPPEGWLKKCEKICRDNNVLLILDEVQTGLGRTGELFAFEHENVIPDGLILGKALGGGLLPVSAFLAKKELMKVFTPGTHGSTFGGNPLAAKVGLEALRLLESSDLVKKSKKLGEKLLKGITKMKSPLIKDVRGRGLWVAIDVDKNKVSARKVCEALMQNGILTKETHEATLRLAPPLVIDEETLQWAIEVIGKTFRQLAKASK